MKKNSRHKPSAIPSRREGAGRDLVRYATPFSSFPKEGIAQPQPPNNLSDGV